MNAPRIGGPRRNDPVEPPNIDGRPPPHDLDAEAAVISAVLIDPAALDEIADAVAPDDFYSESHRRIFEAMVAVHGAGGTVDIVSVGTRLKDTGRIAQIGGMAYLTQILNSAPSVARVEGYARTVREKRRVRQMIATAQRIAAEGYVPELWGDTGGDADAWLARCEGAVYELASSAQTVRGVGIRAAAAETYDDLCTAVQQGRPPGIPTQLHELDDLMCGLHRGDLTLVAARPGMGKTGLALSIALNIAETPPPLVAEDGRPGMPQGVAFFSLEMPWQQIVLRAFAVKSGVSLQRLRTAKIGLDDWPKITEAARHCAGLPIELDDTPALHVSALRTKIRRIKAKFARAGIRLTAAFVDYLQLMTGRDDSVRGREQEISLISRTLKAIAKEEQVAMVAMSQLNRDVEQRAVKRPQIHDLRESGALEQDADNVAAIYRLEAVGEPVLPEERGKTELILLKQRNGPTGTAVVRYVSGCTRFENF